MRLLFLGFFLWASYASSGIVSSKATKRIEEVKKSLAKTELSGVNARLKVEGATFRDFNLYFPPTKETSGLSSDQYKILKEIRAIVERDLAIVGGFNLMAASREDQDSLLKQKGAEGVSRLTLGINGDRITASIEHKKLITSEKSTEKLKGTKKFAEVIIQSITGEKSYKSFSANLQGKRKLAHLIAKSIYEEYIGPEDIFLLQIAAIKRMGKENQVVLLDFDGNQEEIITSNGWSKSSPYFSPDGKSILYSVVSPEAQGIVEQEIGKSHFEFRIKKPGVNLDPRILPDNSGMLATLSFENKANIYLLSRTGAIKGRVTQGLGLNLSPSISSDGKELAFVSDRSGNPQIYVQSLGDAKATATRLTFQGKYNQTPHFSPDGKFIAFTGRDENKVFDIFLIERASGRISRVTESQGRNQEPYFSPSGRFVVFTSEREGKNKPDIFIANLNGDHQYRLTEASSDKKSSGYFSPVIRPKS